MPLPYPIRPGYAYRACGGAPGECRDGDARCPATAARCAGRPCVVTFDDLARDAPRRGRPSARGVWPMTAGPLSLHDGPIGSARQPSGGATLEPDTHRRGSAKHRESGEGTAVRCTAYLHRRVRRAFGRTGQHAAAGGCLLPGRTTSVTAFADTPGGDQAYRIPARSSRLAALEAPWPLAHPTQQPVPQRAVDVVWSTKRGYCLPWVRPLRHAGFGHDPAGEGATSFAVGGQRPCGRWEAADQTRPYGPATGEKADGRSG